LTNMSIEGGARTAIVEPDQKVYDYLKNAPSAEGRGVGGGRQEMGGVEDRPQRPLRHIPRLRRDKP
jgi:homoaconitase/3-isopropylmalate dehydratase large subunit